MYASVIWRAAGSCLLAFLLSTSISAEDEKPREAEGAAKRSVEAEKKTAEEKTAAGYTKADDEKRPDAEKNPDADKKADTPKPKNSDIFDLSLEELMNVRITSVSKREEVVRQADSAVYVITNEDIRRSGVTHVAEALRMAPERRMSSLVMT
jgi:hypothetical protein